MLSSISFDTTVCDDVPPPEVNLLDKVPVDAETQGSVLRNPLMLSMIASIAKLRAGVDMPETTAAIYATAADAMLRRAASPPSAAAVALLEATFFEAHAAEERIVTLAHVERIPDALPRAGDEIKSLAHYRSSQQVAHALHKRPH